MNISFPIVETTKTGKQSIIEEEVNFPESNMENMPYWSIVVKYKSFYSDLDRSEEYKLLAVF